ncbi:MAG: HPP family protein, partial [Methylococcales bacterium]|nr:HPP family protein [Methylococcales bacterium]
AAFAVGISALLMILLRCLHPPGAATALAPIVVDQQLGDLSLYFVLVPVGLNSAILLILAVIINRWVLNRDYSCFAFHGWQRSFGWYCLQ